jgi:secreted PhoX family phosphatase
MPARTRRQAIQDGARLVAGTSIGLQVMAATGADQAAAKALRSLATHAADKPGYGPLVQSIGDLSLPAGFRAVSFGAAGTPMSDGLKTPNFHDGSAAVDGGGGRIRLIRNQEGYDPGHALGKRRAYDRVAQGGVTTSLFDTASGQLVGSSLILNGTDNNCNGGVTPWRTWLSCEESTVGRGDGFEKPHGYVFEIPLTATAPVDPVPIKAMGRFEHEACAIDPKTGIVYMTEDNGDPGDGFYRYLPHARVRLHRGGRLQMLAIEGRSRYDTTHHQRVGRTLQCEWVTIGDPDPEHADKHPDAVYQQGRERGAARFVGLEGALWSGGSVVVCEDGDGEDVNGGTNFLRCLTPAGEIVTFARVDAPLDLHRWEDGPKGAIGRSELSGACYSPDGQWLFVHLQYPGKTFAITGPWDQGWL